MTHPISKISDRVSWLINTSEHDCRVSLTYYMNTKEDLEVIRRGIRICKRRGEKTKVMHLERKLRQLTKPKNK